MNDIQENNTIVPSKERESKIVDAAKKRFAHYGFSKVSMDEIAADVDMGKASLYYYFPNKESLFHAVLTNEQNDFIMEMEKILSSKLSASKKLLEFTNRRLAFFEHSLNLGTLSFHSFLDTKSFHQKFFMHFEEKELDLINRIIAEGKTKGEFDKKLNPKTGTVLLHCLHGLRLRTLRRIKEQKPNDETINELQVEMNIAVKIFIKGISK